MTTTVDQKASILWRWKRHREERGLAGDVASQCEFNWPSLNGDERRSVMQALARRNEMRNDERPSAPSRVAKHVVTCELGPRKYVETFTGDVEARAFIDLVIGDEAVRWKSPTTFTAKGGVLVVMTEHLEDLWEMKGKRSVELPEPIPDTVTAFLRGKWPQKEASSMTATTATATTTVKDSEEMTSAELCAKHKWSAKAVRVAMRKAKWKKPEGGWVWSRKSKIEAKLEELMS
jgi:hypothetical protein